MSPKVTGKKSNAISRDMIGAADKQINTPLCFNCELELQLLRDYTKRLCCKLHNYNSTKSAATHIRKLHCIAAHNFRSPLLSCANLFSKH